VIRIERSELAVPASNWNMILKAASSAADAVFLDLEDSVAPSEKAAARANVIRGLRELQWGPRTRIYRINGLDTHFAYRDIIEVVEAAGDCLDILMIPKASRPEDVYLVDTLLTQIEAAMGFKNRIGIEAQIETAQGMVNCEEIARASARLEALIFGPGDYAASVGMPSAGIGELDEFDQIYPGHRWHYPLQRIVVAAKAAGLRAIDGPFAGIRDPEGFRKSCLIARSLGCDGKWAIHPSQIEIANEVFSPGPDEIERARRIVAAYETALAEGRGAIAVDGKMVDAASLRMARNTLEQACLAGLV